MARSFESRDRESHFASIATTGKRLALAGAPVLTPDGPMHHAQYDYGRVLYTTSHIEVLDGFGERQSATRVRARAKTPAKSLDNYQHRVYPFQGYTIVDDSHGLQVAYDFGAETFFQGQAQVSAEPINLAAASPLVPDMPSEEFLGILDNTLMQIKPRHLVDERGRSQTQRNNDKFDIRAIGDQLTHLSEYTGTDPVVLFDGSWIDFNVPLHDENHDLWFIDRRYDDDHSDGTFTIVKDTLTGFAQDTELIFTLQQERNRYDGQGTLLQSVRPDRPTLGAEGHITCKEVAPTIAIVSPDIEYRKTIKGLLGLAIDQRTHDRG